MKWLINLENYNISFNINILKKNDYILVNQETKKTKIIYILDGFIQNIQIFTNNEIVCLNLLYSHNLIPTTQPLIKKTDKQTNHYYKFIALTRTIILIIDKKEFLQKMQPNNQLFQELTHKHLNYNKEMISILSHRNTKKRLIQLLLILIKHFGVFTEYKILIPFNLSHYRIATIIGSQRITVNKIMNELKKNKSYYTTINKSLFSV